MTGEGESGGIEGGQMGSFFSECGQVPPVRVEAPRPSKSLLLLGAAACLL